jgi:trehalose 6-phosphate synthase/phosphatase
MSTRAVKQAYERTSKRVIILDFNGTIVLKEPPGKYLKREILGTSGNKPPPEVLNALTALCQDPKNTVYVVSGDSSENIINALGHIPGLGLAVSNGARFCRPTAPDDNSRTWFTFDLGVDWDAVKKVRRSVFFYFEVGTEFDTFGKCLQVALPVLSKYTARSNGSFVKLTALSIGWSYYSCDPEWGSLQASYLVLELESELRAFDVRFVTLKGIVEIVPRKLNKGLIVKRVLREAQQQSSNGVDFVLCFGDDISDEKMFTSVFSFIAEMEDDATAFKPSPPVVTDDGRLVVDNDMMHHQASLAKIRDPMYAFTVAVGKKTSHASSFVNDAQEVANALVVLADVTVPMGVSTWGSEHSALFT